MSLQIPFKTTSDRYDSIYRGKILDNNDPLQRGRVKAEIYPMFKGITSTDLPWAIPLFPSFEGANPGVGFFSVPKIGSMMAFYFEEGNVYSPVCIGEYPDGMNGVPVSALVNYPNRKVWKTTSGVEIIVDDTAKSIDLKTPSGHVLSVDDTANISKLVTSNGIQVILNDATQYMQLIHPSGSSIQFDPIAQITISCSALNVSTATSGSSGNAQITVTGNVNLNVTGSTTLQSGGATTIMGSTVSINP